MGQARIGNNLFLGSKVAEYLGQLQAYLAIITSFGERTRFSGNGGIVQGSHGAVGVGYRKKNESLHC
jgi:hypothetical protein